MQKVQAVLVVMLLGALAGCPEGSRMNLIRPNGGTTMATNTAPPPKEALVEYLNNNAARIPGIQSNDITLTCYAGSPVGISLNGKLCAQGPRKFRLAGNFMANQEVDLGSNDQEFWYWIRQGDKYQFYCPYQALEEGKVKYLPFPFQPDWVLEAMGMGNYGSPDKYEIVSEKDEIKLIERTKSPQGVPVRKVIVFKSTKATREDEPQVRRLLLEDDKTGKLICSAQVVRRQVINGAELPRELKLEWPEQKLKLVLHLDRLQFSQDLPARAFVRAPLTGVPAFDLATGRVEGMQQVGGPKTPR
jgi:hypothetical protein